MAVNVTFCDNKDFRLAMAGCIMSTSKKEKMIEYFSRKNAEIPYEAVIIYKQLNKLSKTANKNESVVGWRIMAVGDTVADLIINRDSAKTDKLKKINNNLQSILKSENIEKELSKYTIDDGLSK